jgi:hypothetical protein
VIRPALIAPLFLVVACDSIEPGNDSPDPGASVPAGAAAPGDGSVAVALLRPNAAGATAAVSGVLALRGRCLVLEAGGTIINLAFATAETSWDEAGRALRVGGRSFPLGTRMEIGGALFAGNMAALPWVREPAAECHENLWIVSSI